ncbi:Uncharacterised protein [Mycobacterium tuberculosis]|nr:Uncharacterised protein [Mycobacterium tuberculosis]
MRKKKKELRNRAVTINLSQKEFEMTTPTLLPTNATSPHRFMNSIP